MHKIFAKTLFLGKNVIFLPQCHSTNEEARNLNQSGRLPDGSLVWTDYQEKGKGQQGNAWLSERGKNLLFTIHLKAEFLAPGNQYLLNLVSSLALYDVVAANLADAKVEIKWPNDIYADDRKIAGILTETVISKGKLEQVYCGIGLNVNQSHFQLPTAVSMHMISGVEHAKEEVLENILIAFEHYYGFLKTHPTQLISQYRINLRWLEEPHTFKVSEEEIDGAITGIDDHGKLALRCGDVVRFFDVKEIEFLH